MRVLVCVCVYGGLVHVNEIVSSARCVCVCGSRSAPVASAALSVYANINVSKTYNVDFFGMCFHGIGEFVETILWPKNQFA